jgi:tetratricopeptide (TPR) repeat protein
LGIYKEVGNRHRDGRVLNCIGNAYRELGKINEAIECFEQAMKVHREVGTAGVRARHFTTLLSPFNSLSGRVRPEFVGRKRSLSSPRLGPPTL